HHLTDPLSRGGRGSRPHPRLGHALSETTETRVGDVMSARLPVLEAFIRDLRAVWAAESENQRRMERAKGLLEKFVMEPSLKAHSTSWPSTEGHKNLLLYVDPDHHFVINAVVRVPGRKGSVHDHA